MRQPNDSPRLLTSVIKFAFFYFTHWISLPFWSEIARKCVTLKITSKLPHSKIKRCIFCSKLNFDCGCRQSVKSKSQSNGSPFFTKTTCAVLRLSVYNTFLLQLYLAWCFVEDFVFFMLFLAISRNLRISVYRIRGLRNTEWFLL